MINTKHLQSAPYFQELAFSEIWYSPTSTTGGALLRCGVTGGAFSDLLAYGSIFISGMELEGLLGWPWIYLFPINLTSVLSKYSLHLVGCREITAGPAEFDGTSEQPNHTCDLG